MSWLSSRESKGKERGEEKMKIFPNTRVGNQGEREGERANSKGPQGTIAVWGNCGTGVRVPDLS